jgi:hypothetical protein
MGDTEAPMRKIEDADDLVAARRARRASGGDAVTALT